MFKTNPYDMKKMKCLKTFCRKKCMIKIAKVKVLVLTKVLFRFKNFHHKVSHRIFRRIHEALNINKTTTTTTKPLSPKQVGVG